MITPMSDHHQGTVIGLAAGAALGMLLLLLFLIAVPTTACVPALASVGVFLGCLAVMLVGMAWVVAVPATTHFVVTELA